MPESNELRWFQDYKNMILLTRWMADEDGATGSEIADAVEKPWKYEEEFLNAGGVLTEREAARIVPAPEWTI
jgi:hypothetical protein